MNLRPLAAPFVKFGTMLGKIPPRWQFAAFLAITLIVSLGLTVVAYVLYLVSGTAQLDLSRPGYKQALSEVAPNTPDDFSFSSSGPLSVSVLNDFKTQYDQLIGRTTNYSAFDPSAMSDDQLNLFGPSQPDTGSTTDPSMSQ